jgi:hypothetical protein
MKCSCIIALERELHNQTAVVRSLNDLHVRWI